MLAAERLFGLHSVEGVTVKELLNAAGQGNKSAVQHYFGSKEGLLEAVRDMRLPELELARAGWADRLPSPATSVVTEYLAALFLPVLQVMSDDELASYSQFNLRLLYTGIPDQSFKRMAARSPVTRRLVAGLNECVPDLPGPVFSERLRLATAVLLGAVSEWQRLKGASSPNPYPSEAVFWTDMLAAASSILLTPLATTVLPFTADLVRPLPGPPLDTMPVQRTRGSRRSSAAE